MAIKILPDLFVGDASRVARFQRDAQLLAAVSHPHIAAIYGLEESGGSRFLVLELVDGESLGDRLSASGRKRAFEGEDVSETLATVLKGEPDWSALPAHVPPVIRTLLRRCLTKDRKQRISDLSTVLFVLDEAAIAAPAAATLPSAVSRHPRWKRASVQPFPAPPSNIKSPKTTRATTPAGRRGQRQYPSRYPRS